MIEERLLDLNFVLHDIPPDGNCMFRSLEDQLSFQSTSALGFEHKPIDHSGLRKVAADHIRGNREDFEPFLEGPLDEYCERMESTAEWGKSGSLGREEVEEVGRAATQPGWVGLA